jgi:hypothetical protein
VCRVAWSSVSLIGSPRAGPNGLHSIAHPLVAPEAVVDFEVISLWSSYTVHGSLVEGHAAA